MCEELRVSMNNVTAQGGAGLWHYKAISPTSSRAPLFGNACQTMGPAQSQRAQAAHGCSLRCDGQHQGGEHAGAGAEGAAFLG